VDDETGQMIRALDELKLAVQENQSRNRAMLMRIGLVRAELEAGERLADVVGVESGEGLVELIAANVEALHTTGAMFRVVHARSLRAEGLTIAAIADHYGLTRQRVSALLKQEGSTRLLAPDAGD